MGVDGFRVDLAGSIVKDNVDGKYSCEVWRKIFGKGREEYLEAIFVSEWGQPMYAVKNGDFDIDIEYTVNIKTGDALASSNIEMTENKITLKPIPYVWMKLSE